MSQSMNDDGRFGLDRRTKLLGPVKLDSGAQFAPVEFAYETYGRLNADKSNAILICHALTGDQYVASTHPVTGKPGWWQRLVGEGKPVDPSRDPWSQFLDLAGKPVVLTVSKKPVMDKDAKDVVVTAPNRECIGLLVFPQLADQEAVLFEVFADDAFVGGSHDPVLGRNGEMSLHSHPPDAPTTRKHSSASSVGTPLSAG